MKRIVATFIGIIVVLSAVVAICASAANIFDEAFFTDNVVFLAARETTRMVKSNFHSLETGSDNALNTYSAILMSWGTVVDARWGKDGFEKMTCARDRRDLVECESCIKCETMNIAEKREMRQWRNSLFAVTRAYLKNPEVLRSVYQLYKRTIIEGIKAENGQAEMREYLDAISKYFASDNDVVKEMRRSIATYKADTNRGKPAPDWYAYEFAKRRRAEGGDKLVKEYRKILWDLADSLR